MIVYEFEDREAAEFTIAQLNAMKVNFSVTMVGSKCVVKYWKGN